MFFSIVLKVTSMLLYKLTDRYEKAVFNKDLLCLVISRTFIWKIQVLNHPVYFNLVLNSLRYTAIKHTYQIFIFLQHMKVSLME